MMMIVRIMMMMMKLTMKITITIKMRTNYLINYVNFGSCRKRTRCDSIFRFSEIKTEFFLFML